MMHELWRDPPGHLTDRARLAWLRLAPRLLTAERFALAFERLCSSIAMVDALRRIDPDVIGRAAALRGAERQLRMWGRAFRGCP